jgi:hypothetical protein
LPPEETEAPEIGAPAVFVTFPVTVPTAAAVAEIWIMLPTDGTPEPFRRNNM